MISRFEMFLDVTFPVYRIELFDLAHVKFNVQIRPRITGSLETPNSE